MFQVGDEQEQVKDSSVGRTGSSLSNRSSHDRSSSKSDSGDEVVRATVPAAVEHESKRMNGQVNSRAAQPLPRVSESKQNHARMTQLDSDSGSTRSYTPSKSVDRSDAESISTTISQDSRGSNKENNHNHESREVEEVVIMRQKPEYARNHTRQRTKEDMELRDLKKTTRKRTRRFVIDGIVVTTTTSKVIYGDDENGNVYEDRKQELRELKLLQKIEKKQSQDLFQKSQLNKEQQEKRFEQVCGFLD